MGITFDEKGALPMKKSLNFWSLIFSFVCILLFLLVSFSGMINYSIMGIHPLHLVLYITLITLVLGVLGFSGVQDFKGMIRSITTIILTLALSAILTVILFFGHILG